MSARDPVDPIAVLVADTGASEELLCFHPRQVPERDAAEEIPEGARPAGHRGFAPRKDDPSVVRQGRQECLPQPRVQESEQLVRVDEEDDPCPTLTQTGRCVVRRLELATRSGFEGGEEPTWRRFDGPSVQAQDGRTGRTCLESEGFDQSGFTHTRDA